MNTKKIKELIDLMNDNDLAEVEVEQEGMKVKLTKRASGVIERVVSPVVERREAVLPVPQPQSAESPKEPAGNVKEIKAPMVGTFYRAPAPDADPYVEVGTQVKKGDVLCVIEAMKLMNEIKAEISGKIVKINVENAAPVEFGQVLFVVSAD